MADCPGVLHLAEMADGGLARVRTPGGRLTAAQGRAVADLAERFGSGVVDLTNRANLQIRGLPLDAGAALGAGLFDAGLFVDGPADRRRNILLDPLSGLDPTEALDLRLLSEKLDQALTAASWIAELSPKFAFVLDGGGRTGIAATASDVGFFAARRTFSQDGDLAVSLSGEALELSIPLKNAVAAGLAIAHMAAVLGLDGRGRDLSRDAVTGSLVAAGLAQPADAHPFPSTVRAAFGVVETRDPARVALAIPVAVGRLDPARLRWLAEAAERHGDGALVLAPWSAVVLPGVAVDRTEALQAASEQAGFPPVDIVERLTVIACAGAPACVRAREPAKAIGLALVAAATARPDLLPAEHRRVHVSACAKGCAGSAPADLLLLGSSDEGGFSVHANGAPRRPGSALGRMTTVEPLELLKRLGAQGA